MKIITGNQEGYNFRFRFAGTYLHGQIENDYKYDLFAFNIPISLSEGIHHFTLDCGRDVLFFLWHDTSSLEGVRAWRGLLIYADDYSNVLYALKSFNTKKQNI